MNKLEEYFNQITAKRSEILNGVLEFIAIALVFIAIIGLFSVMSFSKGY